MKPGWAGKLLQKCPPAANRSVTVFGDTGGPLQVFNYNSEATVQNFITHTGITAASNIYVKEPRLQVVWSSRPQPPQVQYPIGFHRFTTYKKSVTVATGGYGSVSWSNIACDIVPYCFVVCLRSIDTFNDCNFFAPTRFQSVRVQTSVSSQPCGNYTGERGSLADQYRIYKRMTKNREIAYRDWYRYRRCLCFGASELGGSGPGMFRNAYQPQNLSVSLEFDRDASVKMDDVAAEAAGPETYNCYLIMCTDATCVLSEAGVRVSEVKLSPQEVLTAFQGGGGQKTLSDRGIKY